MHRRRHQRRLSTPLTDDGYTGMAPMVSVIHILHGDSRASTPSTRRLAEYEGFLFRTSRDVKLQGFRPAGSLDDAKYSRSISTGCNYDRFREKSTGFFSNLPKRVYAFFKEKQDIFSV